MDDLLTKPVTPEVLDATLQKWMAIADTGRLRSHVGTALDPVQLPNLAPANDEQPPAAADPAEGEPVLIDQRRSARLLQTFLSTVPSQVEALVAAAGGSDLSVVRGHAHKLKGSASSLGALRMSKLCAAIQHAADRDESEHLAAWSQLVAQALVELTTLLEAELNHKQASPRTH